MNLDIHYILKYRDILKNSLTTLSTRRKRGDLIRMYKIINKHDQIDSQKQLDIYDQRLKTRGNRHKLRTEIISTVFQESNSLQIE